MNLSPLGVALGLLQREVDGGHGVVGGHGEVAGAQLGAVVGGEVARELLVLRRVVGERIVVAGDQAERHVAGGVQVAVVGGFTGGVELDAGLLHAALLPHLEERRRHHARGKEEEHGLGLGVLDALHVGREVGVVHRRAHLARDLAAAGGEGLLERGFGIDARGVVGDHGVGVLDAFLQHEARHRIGDLLHGERQPRDVGRAVGDGRGGRVHHEGRDLGLRGDGAHGIGVGAEVQAGEDAHLVAHDQFLRDALGGVGRGAGGVFLDDLDGAPAHLAAVLLQIERDAGIELAAVVGVGAGVGGNEADAQRLVGGLRGHGAQHAEAGEQEGRENGSLRHRRHGKTPFRWSGCKAGECASDLCLWNAHPQAIEGCCHVELAAQARGGLALGRDDFEQCALHVVGRRQQVGEGVVHVDMAGGAGAAAAAFGVDAAHVAADGGLHDAGADLGVDRAGGAVLEDVVDRGH
jgi:hypothetical protein